MMDKARTLIPAVMIAAAVALLGCVPESTHDQVSPAPQVVGSAEVQEATTTPAREETAVGIVASVQPMWEDVPSGANPPVAAGQAGEIDGKSRPASGKGRLTVGVEGEGLAEESEPLVVTLRIPEPRRAAGRKQGDVEFHVVASGTAVAGDDFRLFDASGLEMTKPYTVTIASDQAEAWFSIVPVVDEVSEPEEQLWLQVWRDGKSRRHEVAVAFAPDAAGETTGLDGLDNLEITALGDSWPEFQPDVYDYAVRCEGKVSIAASHRAPVAVSGVVALNGAAVVAAQPGDTIDVAVPGGPDYRVHCVPRDFPDIRVSGAPADGWAGLITAGLGLSGRHIGDLDIEEFGFFVLMDSNGVPHWLRRSLRHGGDQPASAGLLKVTGHADAPFAYVKRGAGRQSENCAATYVVTLDDAMNELRARHTVAPLTCTNGHDFDVTPAGHLVLQSYEPAVRDFSAYGDYSVEEKTRDSVVQVIDVAGNELFRWNSWDHIPLEDCRIHRFPDDYSHINSVQYVGGDYLASLRGCSTVVMIDGETGQVRWRLGRTNLTDEEYELRGFTKPTLPHGDPEGEFCGQHSARMVGDDRMLLFDNGSNCQADAAGYTVRLNDEFSRVVEYRIDPRTGAATFLRDHTLADARTALGYSSGNVSALPNGNWLISWGWSRDDPERSPGETITEYDPEADVEIWSLSVTVPGYGVALATRPYAVPHGLWRRDTE